MSARRLASDLIALVLDDGSFTSWDSPIDVSRWPESYQRELARAAERSGRDESVTTGRGTVRGRPVAVVASEFRFLAGSIGEDAAGRIVAAVRRATAERIPVLATTASGGTRMQEGTPAFLHMIDISRALMDHKAAGLPYLVHLGHPTTGGVFASWGSLGHVTVAEPDALVGFLGPKVYEVLNHSPFPEGVQTAENLAHHGIIDAVVAAEDLPALVDRTLGILVDPPKPASLSRRDPVTEAAVPTWTAIERTRAPGRIGVRDVLRAGGEDTIRLQGTDEGERDSAMIVALTRLDGEPCVVVGQDRKAQARAPMGPGALREARRGMRLANELGLPLVSVIDTPGAELSAAAEEGAIAGEIARCIASMATMTVPTVAVLLGEGCGGGALALFPADVVVATQSAWLSPLPPEGASAIVHGDADHAAEMAEAQRVSAADLLAAGKVNVLVPERDSDTDDPSDLARAVAAEAATQLRTLRAATPSRTSYEARHMAHDPYDVPEEGALTLARRVAEADGVSPLNEASRIAIAAGETARVDEGVTADGRTVAVAYAAGDAPVELFVDPDHRRQGHGRTLLDLLRARGESQFWAHGDLPPAQALAEAAGLTPVRTLLVLERSTSDPLPDERPVDGVTLRTWRDDDAEGLLRVNAAAFAHHPEQGAMDLADLRSRMAQPWFDPAGLFVAERDGRVVGFHWTKVDPPVADGGEVGEVYVVGVDPSEQGRGLGKALTLRGLHHLRDLGLARIDLYVEGDNTPALATYHGLGFTESARDVLYAATP